MSHRLPPLNGVRAFEASARHLSFKLAAAELGVTAGAVGQQVKSLEEALGVALFKRVPRGLLLTNAGETYLPDLSRAFRLISDATEKVAPALPGRKLRIGLSAELKRCLPARWPKGFDTVDPHVVCPRVTDDLELVLSAEIDGLLGLGNARASGLSIETIATVRTDHGLEDVHYACQTGIAGCKQSRALVAGLQSVLE